MNDNEIIKALEKALATGDAPVGEHWGCSITTKLAKETFDMLSRQKAEIERLTKENKEKKLILEAINDEMNPLPFETDFDKAIKQAKSKAYREFNARLYAYKTNIFIKGEELMIIPMFDYDEILKELTESNE